MTTSHATLMFLRRNNEILLGYKKRGFGEGKWNGIGGKVNEGESVLQAALRETKEEIGVDVSGSAQQVGIITFESKGQNDRQIIASVYTAYEWVGTPTESQEMRPKWFSVDTIPYEHMWPDDALWLPRLIDNQKINDYYVFDDAMNIVEHKTMHNATFTPKLTV